MQFQVCEQVVHRLQVLTSCNSTKEELVEQFCHAAVRTAPAEDDVSAVTSAAEKLDGIHLSSTPAASTNCLSTDSNSGIVNDHNNARKTCSGVRDVAHSEASLQAFELVDWVRTYPTFRFGGIEGTRVCTVAFRRRP